MHKKQNYAFIIYVPPKKEAKPALASFLLVIHIYLCTRAYIHPQKKQCAFMRCLPKKKQVKPALATFLLVSGVLPLLSSIPNAISGAECPTYVIKKASLGGVAGVDLREYEPFPAAAMETSGRSARERMQVSSKEVVKR
jgi:hypothetical protein